MPWTENDAERHTRKATTSELKELWAKVANESLERTGDEGRAIREANAVVARQAGTLALEGPVSVLGHKRKRLHRMSALHRESDIRWRCLPWLSRRKWSL